MTKEDIMNLFEEEYQTSKSSSNQLIEQMNHKLLATTQQFARSFDYVLPNEYGVKGKLNTFRKRVIRKLTRFILKPYADQMLKFQESICELQGMYIGEFDRLNSDTLEKKIIENIKSELAQNDRISSIEEKIMNHEEAIYKQSLQLNDTTNIVLKVNGELHSENNDDNESFSQCGEDQILEFIFNACKRDVHSINYVDIGCNRYNELNNTYKFYKLGGKGVLLDANPKFIGDVKQYRPNDIPLNAGIGVKSGEKLTFYSLNWDWLSSFNYEFVKKTIEESPWVKVEEEIEVPIVTLTDLFEKYCERIPDFVSIDVEGDELGILQSVDMNKYRPLVYIVETIDYKEKIDLNNKRTDIIDYMKSVGYHEYAFTGVNSIFIDSKQV